MIRLRAVELRLVRIPLRSPFRTSFGEEGLKEAILIRVLTDDGLGWGECVAAREPRYSEEFNEGAWAVLRHHLIPALLESGDVEPEQVGPALSFVRGHRMAKASLEMALLDAELRSRGEPLAAYLGADRDRVQCGVSVGIAGSIDSLLDQVSGFVGQGYVRLKLKIEPGWDVLPVTAVRETFPGTPLSVDANGVYRLTDMSLFEALDALDLVMIEQPLAPDDLLDHAALQRRLLTPICLDESIHSATQARAAIDVGACRIVNIKVGRLGGLLEARRVHDVARDRGAPVWCGGMLETGVGRAANLALAALPGFILPGDTSASDRYFAEDLTDPFVLDADGTMGVPKGPGIGVDPRPDRLEACTVRSEVIEGR